MRREATGHMVRGCPGRQGFVRFAGVFVYHVVTCRCRRGNALRCLSVAQPASAPIIIAGAASGARSVNGAVIVEKVPRGCIIALTSGRGSPGAIARPVGFAAAVMPEGALRLSIGSGSGFHCPH